MAALTLYRVGTPSIGEGYMGRWRWTRGTGGLGTGVYAFRTEDAARENIQSSSPGRELVVLHDALDNPIQPTTLDATRNLNQMSRKVALLASLDRRGEYGINEAIEAPGETKVTTSPWGDQSHVGNGSFLTSDAFTVLLNTPELREEYGLDKEAFVRDFLKAATVASRRCEGFTSGACVQPINELLHPRHDGVAPHVGAGGDSGDHGCVVFKEVVDDCVGHKTDQGEQVSGDRLNRCFQQS
jgi:hypothetical protein